MKNSHKGLIVPIILVLIALLLASGGVYVYMQNKQAGAPVVESPVTQATSTVEITDSQPDWITYNDADYTFDLPATWRITDVPPGHSLQIFSSSADSNSSRYDNSEIIVDVVLMATNNTQTLKEWCELSINNQDWGLVFNNTHYLTVGGEKAYSVDYNYKDPPTWSARRICIAKGNDKYIMEGSPIGSRFMSTFDKIVTSFQFTK